MVDMNVCEEVLEDLGKNYLMVLEYILGIISMWDFRLLTIIIKIFLIL